MPCGDCERSTARLDKGLLHGGGHERRVVLLRLSRPLDSVSGASLWAFDSVCRGRNLGTKGRLLDSSETNVNWTAHPLECPNSELKIAHIGAGSELMAALRHGGTQLLNFTQPFTLGLWLKTDDVYGRMPILDGYNDEARARTLQFGFLWSFYQNQLMVIGYRKIFSVKNLPGRTTWRHIAVMYLGGTEYDFFLNGRRINPFDNGTLVSARQDTDRLFIGMVAYNRGSFLQAKLACVSMFERSMTADELEKWTATCP